MSCQNIWILPNDNMFYAKAYKASRWKINTREYLLDSWHRAEKKKVTNFKEKDYFLFKAS